MEWNYPYMSELEFGVILSSGLCINLRVRREGVIVIVLVYRIAGRKDKKVRLNE
jgi:hypothetical protein